MGVPMIFAISPILGWSWPALTPILVATAGALGYGLITTQKAGKRVLDRLSKRLANLRMVEISLEEHLRDVVCEELGHEEALYFEKDDLILVFGHDSRGRFFVRVAGPKEKPAIELRHEGDEFARKLIQQFAYNRIMAELDRRGVVVVEENVDNEGNIHLRTRRW